ncbi:MAG: hypothetical protein LC624_03000 [Halobacteriales archaeon]|nr:hypothetical protein [Halobacteriales archaeon]
MDARLLGAALLALTVLAGCTAQPATQQPLTQSAPAQVTAPASFDLEGQRCLLGGGHSVHSTSVAPLIIPEPWKVADILGDVGPQLVYPEEPEEGVPSEGKTWGNWHVTILCDAWQYDGKDVPGLVFGFVVTKVEQPPFDTGPPGPRYIMNVLATGDHGMHEALHKLGFHASTTTGTSEWTAPDVYHNLLDTADHGVYESIFHTSPFGDVPQNLTRLWFQRMNDDSTFTPIALDLWLHGGKHLIADPDGYFSHLRTQDHAPIPGAVGNIAGLVYQDADVTLKLGPVADVKLDKAYEHL